MNRHHEAEDCRFLKYRRKTFSRMLEEITNLVSGRGSSLLPFIADEEGNITDARTDALINELLDGLKRYNEQVGVYEPFGHSPELREFYACFLYCAIRGIADIENADIDDYIMVRPVTRFEDILKMTRDPQTLAVRSVSALREQELDARYTHYVQTGFFGCCDLAYEMLTGASVAEEFSAEERAEHIAPDKRMYQQLAEAGGFGSAEEYVEDMLMEDAKAEGFDSVEEYEQYCSELAEGNEISEEEMEDIEAELEYCRQAQESRERWKQGMSSGEEFIRRYRRYRELYFSVERGRMVTDMENMIDAFLYEHKLSAFSLEEKYGMISYRLETMQSVLKNELRKAGREI